MLKILKKVFDFVKRYWQVFLGFLLAAIGMISLKKGTPIDSRAKEIQDKARKLEIESSTEKTLHDKRNKQADVNKANADELEKRLEALKKRSNIFPAIFLIVLIPALMFYGQAYASSEPVAPSDYEGLHFLYLSAMEQIRILTFERNEAIDERDEAIDIADGYRALYESERRLRFEAEDAVLRGLTREAQQRELIAQQHKIILELSSGKKINFSVGAFIMKPCKFDSDKPYPGVFASVSF